MHYRTDLELWCVWISLEVAQQTNVNTYINKYRESVGSR